MNFTGLTLTNRGKNSARTNGLSEGELEGTGISGFPCLLDPDPIGARVVTSYHRKFLAWTTTTTPVSFVAGCASHATLALVIFMMTL